MTIRLMCNNPDLLNGPVTFGNTYEVEGENNGKTHFQHRNDDGHLVWNKKEYFDEVQDK